MNDWSAVESHLRSWKPRGPSAKVKARLFPPVASGDAAAVDWAALFCPASWRWLAPSMTAFVLAVLALGRNAENFTGFAGVNSTSLVATVAFDHPGLAAYSDASHHSDANMLPAHLWERGAGSSPVLQSVPMSATNRF